MDVRKSPFRARMASKGRLRPHAITLSEYLENSFDEADTREQFAQRALRSVYYISYPANWLW